MEELGLPRTVQILLSTLLSENVVSSWKVSSSEEGKSAVFILRLTPVSEHSSTRGLHQGAVGQWRKKSPSETRRDAQRAFHRRQQQQQQQQQLQRVNQPPQQSQLDQQCKPLHKVHEGDEANTAIIATNPTPQNEDDKKPAETTVAFDSDENNKNQDSSMDTEDNNCNTSPAGLFTSSHDILNESSETGCDTLSVCDWASDTSSDQRHNACTTEATTTTRLHAESPPTQEGETERIVSLEGKTVDTNQRDGDDSNREKKETNHQPQNTAEKGSSKFDQVKQHVGSVTDRHHQRLLRDKTRNNDIKKMVMKGELAIGESDDLVVYNNTTTNYWNFIIKCLDDSKSKRQCLTSTEKEIMSFLHANEHNIDYLYFYKLEMLLGNARRLTRDLMG